MNSGVFRLGPFDLNVREHLLLRDGSAISLRGKVFDTLRVPVENAGRLVKKEELLRTVWPDTGAKEKNSPPRQDRFGCRICRRSRRFKMGAKCWTQRQIVT